MNSKQDLLWYVKHRKEFLKLPDEKPFFLFIFSARERDFFVYMLICFII